MSSDPNRDSEDVEAIIEDLANIRIENEASVVNGAMIDNSTQNDSESQDNESVSSGRANNVDAVAMALAELGVLGLDEIRDYLNEIGINPSKGYLKTLMKKLNLHRCISCVHHFESREKLAEHIVHECKPFGQKKIAGLRRSLLYRLRRSHPNDFPQVNLMEESSTSLLSNEELAAYLTLGNVNYLSNAEKATLQQIWDLEICLVTLRLRRSRKSKKSE